MVKQNKIVILLLIFIIPVASCEKQDEILIDITNQCSFQENILSPCFFGIDNSGYDEIVIKNNEEYRSFEDSLRINPANLDCDSAGLAPIDFVNYSLIGIRTTGGGCYAEYERHVFQNNRNNTVVYRIQTDYFGTCEKLIVNWNWAYIPKLPDNYLVEFQLD